MSNLLSHLSVTALTLLLLFASDLTAAPRHWVFFRDKGETVRDESTAMSHLREDWPERSFNRRLKSGVGFDRSDLSVHPSYITQVVEAGGEIVESSRWLNAVSVASGDEALRRIRELDCVTGVQPVARFKRNRTWVIEREALNTPPLSPPTDAGGDTHIPLGAYGPSYRQAELANVIEAHRRGLTGAGVFLGALDTGFDLTHRAFTGIELVAQYDFIFDDPDPSWDFWTDPKGQANHGTGCLSTIVGYDPGHLVGIAPRVAVAVGKTEMTGSETIVEEDYWIAGIEWLEWLGVDVVTSSLSYRDWYNAADMDGLTPLVTRAAQRACELGIVICNSASNDGPGSITIGAPADAPDVLAIAAVDSNGQVTEFSSRGPSADGRIKPDVAAMGSKVVCVTPMTWNYYSRWGGTSLSCPLVAGVAALVIEAHPDWPAWQVADAIRMSADRSFMPDYDYGYGIVDAVAAIDYPSLKGRIMLAGVGITAQLSMALGDRVYRVDADELGYYSFPNLPEGVYLLTVASPQYPIRQIEDLLFPPSMWLDVQVGR